MIGVGVRNEKNNVRSKTDLRLPLSRRRYVFAQQVSLEMACCTDKVHWFDKGSKYFIILDRNDCWASRSMIPTCSDVGLVPDPKNTNTDFLS